MTRAGFDWPAQQARLNEFPQFTEDIDRQVVHFLHVRSDRPDAFPVILTHGWPNSFAEFSTWSASDWLSDAVPHLVYGTVTYATLQALNRRPD